jgi:hypothetical protein
MHVDAPAILSQPTAERKRDQKGAIELLVRAARAPQEIGDQTPDGSGGPVGETPPTPGEDGAKGAR